MFGGLNLRVGAANTREAVIADDIDLINDAILPKRQNTALTSNTLATPVKDIFRIGANLYCVSNGNIYPISGGAFGAAVTAGLSASAPIFSARVNNRAYLVDGTNKKVYDGSTVRDMGVVAKPGASLTVTKTSPPIGTSFTQQDIFVDTSYVPSVVITRPGGPGDALFITWIVTAIITKAGVTRETVPVEWTLGDGDDIITGAGTDLNWSAYTPPTGWTLTKYRVYMGLVSQPGWTFTNPPYNYCETTDATTTGVNFKATTVAWPNFTGAVWTKLNGTAVTGFAPTTNQNPLWQGQLLVNNVSSPATLPVSARVSFSVVAPNALTFGSLVLPMNTAGEGTDSGLQVTCRIYEQDASVALTDPESGTLVGTYTGTALKGIPLPSNQGGTFRNGFAYGMPKANFNFTGIQACTPGKRYSFVFYQPQGKSIYIGIDEVCASTAYAGAYTSYRSTGDWVCVTDATNGKLPKGVTLSITNPASNGVLKGTYTWGYTFYSTTLGFETDIKETTDVNDNIIMSTLEDQTATLTGFSALPAGYDRYRIYRLGGAWTEFMRVATITAGAPTSFEDGVADEGLSEPLTTLGLTAPPALDGIIYANGRLYGWKGDTIYTSQVFPDIEAWKSASDFVKASDSGASVLQCFPLNGEIIVISTDGVRILAGGDVETFSLRDIPGSPGGVSYKGGAHGDGMVMYLTQRGLYALDTWRSVPILPTELTPLFDGSDANYPWGVDTAGMMGYFDKRFLLSYAARNTLLLDGKTVPGNTMAHVDTIKPTAFYQDPTTGALIFSADSGTNQHKLYQWRNSATRNASFTYMSVLNDKGAPLVWKEFEKLVCDYKGAISFTLYVNGSSVLTPTPETKTVRSWLEAIAFKYGTNFQVKAVATANTAELYDFDATFKEMARGT